MFSLLSLTPRAAALSECCFGIYLPCQFRRPHSRAVLGGAWLLAGGRASWPLRRGRALSPGLCAAASPPPWKRSAHGVRQHSKHGPNSMYIPIFSLWHVVCPNRSAHTHLSSRWMGSLAVAWTIEGVGGLHWTTLLLFLDSVNRRLHCCCLWFTQRGKEKLQSPLNG